MKTTSCSPFHPRELRALFTAGLLFLTAVGFGRVAVAGTQTGPGFVVNTLADTNDGQCDASGQGTGNKDCTLREAINAANSYGGGALISFNLSGTITLGSVLPNIATNMSIDGSGQRVTVSGNNSVGIFELSGLLYTDMTGHYTVSFNALTIANSAGTRGAIFVHGSAAVITDCLFENNDSGNGSGGALAVDQGSSAMVANCTFFNNSAATGGGIYILGDAPGRFPAALYIYSSTFYNNHAFLRRGQYGLAPADIYADNGATAEIRDTLLVNTDNRGTNQEDNAQGLTYADHSDIFNIDIDAQSFNATQATAAQINLDTMLKDNGGSTKTFALLPGSVAINAGNNSAATGAPVNNQDQRGFVRVRPGDTTCDVGAYESGANGSLIVTTAADLTSATAGQNSLRTALTYAQSLGGAQTVTFAAPMAGQAVTLSNPWSNADAYRSTSALTIENGPDVTIQGPSAAPGITLKVGDAAQLRHFFIALGGKLTLANLTLTGGKANVGGAAYGGAIWNFGALTVRNCTFTGNTAGAEGGAIQSWGDSPSLSIDNSTFTGNQSNGSGGAIITGAISATFRYVTISNNTSNDGNALIIYKYPLTMVNGLIGGSGNEGVAPSNGGSFSSSSTNNILTTSTAPGLTNGTNANQLGVPVAQLRLGALAYNGGPTPTIALQPGSVAVDAGVAIAGISTDQIGTARPQGNAPDVGAFELIPGLVPGLYAGINGQSGSVETASLIGYPGGTTPKFPLFGGLTYPGGMLFDTVGNLYFTSYDYSANYTRVYKLAQGSSTPQNIASFFSQLAAGMAINPSGDTLYVLTNRAGDTLTRVWTVGLPSGGQNLIYFSSAFVSGGGAMDSAGNLLFADTTNQQILKLANGATSPTVFATGVAARGLAFDRSDNLFVSTNGNTGNDSILKFTPAGARSTFATGLANVPLGLAFDKNSNLFVAETGAANQAGDIIKIDPNGTKTTFDSNVGYLNQSGNGGPQYLAIYPGLPGPVKLAGFVSRQTHNGIGAVDISLPLTGTAGTESRSGGAGGNFQLVLTFVNPLTSVGSVQLSGGTGMVSSAAIGADAHQLLVNLSGVTDAQTISVALGNVNDSTGAQSNALSVSMGVLLGDVNGDGTVNAADATIARSYSGQLTNSADQTSIRCDVNRDGTINSADSTVVRNQSGKSAAAAGATPLSRRSSVQ